MVLDEVAGAYTRTQVLDVVNDCQNQLLGEDNGLMRVRPDPFLATTDATYSYAASTYLYDSTTGAQGSLSGDIRTVREVYSFNNSVSIFDNSTIDPASDKPNQLELTPTKDRVTMRVEVIDSIAPSSSDCTIKIFHGNNPGTTTTTWKCLAYKWPAQLTSEAIALSIPADFQRTLLWLEVLKVLERREYGRNDMAFQQGEFYRKQFRKKYNAQTTLTFTVVKGEQTKDFALTSK